MEITIITEMNSVCSHRKNNEKCRRFKLYFFLSVDGHCGPSAQSIMKIEMVLKTGKRKTVTLYLLQHKVKYAYLKCLFSCI